MIGELSLDGTLRKINGVLSHVIGLKDCGIKTVIVPKENAKEAALIDNVNIYGAKNLSEVVAHFTDTKIPKTEIQESFQGIQV